MTHTRTLFKRCAISHQSCGIAVIFNDSRVQIQTRMKYLFLLLVFIWTSISYAQNDWPPINAGYGYVMIGKTRGLYDDRKIWELSKVGSDTIGIVCFTVDKYKSWYTCDCKTLDSVWAAVRKRFRTDIPWRDSILKAEQEDWDRMEKRVKPYLDSLKNTKHNP